MVFSSGAATGEHLRAVAELIAAGELRPLLVGGFVVEQVLATQAHDEAFFWATHQGAEIDLILRRGDRLLGVECKRADAPA